MSQIGEIRERWSKATRGPWRWFGNTKMHDIYLATTHSGRRFVMKFSRYGMGSAQPVFQVRTETGGIMTKASELVTYEVDYRADITGIDHPDAEAIASAPEDVRVLLEEIDRLRAALKSIAERKCRGGWGGACGEADSSSREAEDALEPSP